ITALESVRNRILSFSLEAEKHVMTDAKTDAQTGASLSNVFHTTIYGFSGNLVQGSSNFTQTNGLAAGDLPTLIAAIREMGVSETDAEELRQAVEEDGPQKKKIGGRVAAWLGTMLSKAAIGAGNLTLTTASTVLPKLVEQYYNLPK